jgi:hypothetical protein
MIAKVVKKRKLGESSVREDLEFWLSQPESARIEAVELLRRQAHGSSERLQRVARVIRQSED